MNLNLFASDMNRAVIFFSGSCSPCPSTLPSTIVVCSHQEFCNQKTSVEKWKPEAPISKTGRGTIKQDPPCWIPPLIKKLHDAIFIQNTMGF